MHQDDFQHSSHQEPMIERRKDDAILLHIKELQAAVKELSAKMNYHHAIFREEVEKSVEHVYQRSFPDGDPEGHRAHHELVIKREEKRLAFWTKMQEEVTKWGSLVYSASWRSLHGKHFY